MKRFVFAVGLLGAILGVTKPAAAELITYTETFTGSGTLNGHAFTNATVVLSGTGDTSDIQAIDSTFYVNDQIAMSVTIGVTTVAFSDSFNIFLNQAPYMQLPSIGFQDNNYSEELSSANSSGFGSYNLEGPLAPLIATGTVGLDTIDSYSTTGGSLMFTGGTGSATVSATAATAAAPEPSSLTIVSIGGLGIGIWFRRRRRTLAA
jgi:hypothetical protein